MAGLGLIIVALVASVIRVSGSASGCPTNMPASETDRRKVFRRIYGKWPPGTSWPDNKPMLETPEWTEYHKQKEAGLMALTDRTQRWEFWLEQVQIRALTNFTPSGWAMGHMPSKLHNKVVENFLKKFKPPEKSSNHSIPLYTTGDQSLIQLDSKLHNDITQEVRKRVAKWVGKTPDDLEPTSTYGVRNYWRGSTLKTHVDRVSTHILSAVYCIAASYPEGAAKWLIETDPDLTGKHVKTEVKPGELFFYESAKLVHGRPSVLEGDYSAHMFIHFRPKGWTVDNIDRVYGVPPGFDDSPRDAGDTDLKAEL